jgi:hypothetical protein
MHHLGRKYGSIESYAWIMNRHHDSHNQWHKPTNQRDPYSIMRSMLGCTCMRFNLSHTSRVLKYSEWQWLFCASNLPLEESTFSLFSVLFVMSYYVTNQHSKSLQIASVCYIEEMIDTDHAEYLEETKSLFNVLNISSLLWALRGAVYHKFKYPFLSFQVSEISHYSLERSSLKVLNWKIKG